MNFYNEHDPFAAAWLRELIKAGHIPYGLVDARSIEDITPDELTRYTQCHFFAGIGGWSYALRLAGWPDDKPVWTGSCPCQPFSAAGKGGGAADERHLWPAFFHLIEQCRPDVIFGEQVEAAINHGWLDLVQADLEGEGYAFGAVGLPAACVGAPHIRQRLWFVADCKGARCGTGRSGEARDGYDSTRVESTGFCATGELDDAHGTRWQPRQPSTASMGYGDSIEPTGDAGELGDTLRSNGSRLKQVGVSMESKQEAGRPGNATPWSDVEFIGCADGKARPAQPGIFPLAHGISSRVGRLRGYGNAIVPQVAAEVIRAYMRG